MQLDDTTAATLVEEVLTLHAEVLALRLLVGAPLSGQPFEYFDEVVANFDAYTLHLAMTEAQRETVRERLEYTRLAWRKQQQAVYPGGWRGLVYCLRRMAIRVHRVIAGAGGPNEPIPRAVEPLPAFT